MRRGQLISSARCVKSCCRQVNSVAAAATLCCTFPATTATCSDKQVPACHATSSSSPEQPPYLNLDAIMFELQHGMQLLHQRLLCGRAGILCCNFSFSSHILAKANGFLPCNHIQAIGLQQCEALSNGRWSGREHLSSSRSPSNLQQRAGPGYQPER